VSRISPTTESRRFESWSETESLSLHETYGALSSQQVNRYELCYFVSTTCEFTEESEMRLFVVDHESYLSSATKARSARPKEYDLEEKEKEKRKKVN
jgi:hypothetical protein